MQLVGAHLRLGELLLDVGIVKKEDITKAVLIAQQRSVPVGRALIMQGCLSEKTLQAAVQVQSLFRDGLITRDESVKALEIACHKEIGLEEALRELRHKPKCGAQRNRLGELLSAAAMLSADQVEQYVKASAESGLPLGRYLVSIGAVSDSVIQTALNIQVLIRDWKITREKAIGILKEANASATEKGSRENERVVVLPAQTTIRLGELLVNAGIVAQSAVSIAVETALIDNEKLGRVLVQSNLITDAELEGALVLQDMVASDKIKLHQATEVMKKFHDEGISEIGALALLSALNADDPESLSLESFVLLAGAVSRLDIDKAVSAGLKDSNIFGKMLIAAGILSESSLKDSQRLHSLVCGNMISLERAIVILKYCFKTGKSVKESIADFGWILSPQAKNQTKVEPSRRDAAVLDCA